MGRIRCNKLLLEKIAGVLQEQGHNASVVPCAWELQAERVSTSTLATIAAKVNTPGWIGTLDDMIRSTLKEAGEPR